MESREKKEKMEIYGYTCVVEKKKREKEKEKKKKRKRVMKERKNNIKNKK